VKILLVTEAHEARGGGLTTAVQELARHAAMAGDEVSLLCTGRDPLSLPEGVSIIQHVPSRAGARWGWSPRLFPAIDAIVRAGVVDRVHVHGIWQAAHWYAARRARSQRIPILLSSHGMLEPYHWNDRGRRQYLMKRAYWTTMAYPAFRHATVIHAITPTEARNLTRLFPGREVHIIPNAVDLDVIDRELGKLETAGPIVREPVVGFIGRFHAKKGLDALIDAFSSARLPSSWRLRIAGPPGTPEYMARINKALARSTRRDRIDVLGPVFGSDKWRFLRTVSVLAVPSLSEAIGLVNLEAAACGTPTITTKATGLDDWEHGGGLLVSTDTEALRAALERVSRLSTEEYVERSRAGRELVEARYSWSVVSVQWKKAYDHLGTGA